MRYATKKEPVTAHLDIIEKLIIDVVEQKEGCKLIDLAIGLGEILKNENLTNIKFDKHEDYVQLITLIQKPLNEQINIIFDKLTELVKNGYLIGISYNLKNKMSAEKMFILPKGTSFKYMRTKES